MNNDTITVNGLMDGISVVEKDNKRYEYYEAVAKTDILYNDREPIEKAFQDLYREEGFSVSEYDPESFNGAINLLSNEEITLKSCYKADDV